MRAAIHKLVNRFSALNEARDLRQSSLILYFAEVEHRIGDVILKFFFELLIDLESIFDNVVAVTVSAVRIGQISSQKHNLRLYNLNQLQAFVDI